ncbi:MAG: hypothetical protein FRX48_09710 [Lasallia pustulata]|uniref:Uncharacterized protein n=1 Tax=Lasallia pustulata TaxID=136370 RepID=A0A5M8PBD8_9LECA|nr:MAG: hypothetical protein FRX48_09710 [Lasallia pustulata]
MILEINPKSVLHQHYKSRKAERTEQPDSTTWDHQDSLRKSIEGCLHTNLSTSIEDSDEEAPFLSPDTDSDSDPEQTFYRNWRYLPPLSEDAVAIMDAILANPATAEKLARVGPDKEDFVEGLRDRNVFLDESEDPRIDYIRNLGSEEVVSETEEQKNVHEPLWYQDQAKCNYGSSNEALYQRTIMMSMIARHCLIYERKLLDFSVEETWTCPPMPTRAYNDNGSFLTQPKPDLAVCFRRQALIPDATWYGLPKATRRLACYENIGETGGERIFHFCAIEAKKGRTAITDDIGKRQSLNNASQALHNMFEFF